MNKSKLIIIISILLVVFISLSIFFILAKEKDDELIIIYVEENEFNSDYLTKIDEFKYDLDGDNINEIIELYTNATKNSADQFMWDDRNFWSLVIRDNNKSYSLFEGYISLGYMKFWVYLSEEDNLIHIATLHESANEISIVDYRYNEKNQNYISKPVSNLEINNLLFTSPSFYWYIRNWAMTHAYFDGHRIVIV